MRNPEAVKLARRKYYHSHKATELTRIKARQTANKQWIIALRQTLSCSSCGESHPATLDFHHTDPTEKESSIAKAVRYGWSKHRIMKEIEKCIVLCSNCHRKLHYNESVV